MQWRSAVSAASACPYRRSPGTPPRSSAGRRLQSRLLPRRTGSRAKFPVPEQKKGLNFQLFPVFVPSLSWQIPGIRSLVAIKQRKKDAFPYQDQAKPSVGTIALLHHLRTRCKRTWNNQPTNQPTRTNTRQQSCQRRHKPLSSRLKLKRKDVMRQSCHNGYI